MMNLTNDSKIRHEKAAQIRVKASRIMQIKPEPNVTSTDDSTLQSDHNPKDSLLGGLLVSGFNKDSCMSRLPISTFTV
ncbi:unnamed protein product [Brassica rapa]|uniref:Uncharacterized protein n=2 Tax=Brassica TaxID=3705 RepID=A0A8D9CVH4_BRACM|nr:unnamed protein product [Brassica napus]CAG7862152.1 unnamed protein product [Brassica rapa]